MTLDERFNELCSAMRREAIDDLLRYAARVRAEGVEVLAEASRVFEPEAVEFLKSMQLFMRLVQNQILNLRKKLD